MNSLTILLVGFTAGMILDFFLSKGVFILYRRRIAALQKQIEDWRQLATDWKNLSRQSQADFVKMNASWRKLFDDSQAAWKKLVRETFGLEVSDPFDTKREKLQ